MSAVGSLPVDVLAAFADATADAAWVSSGTPGKSVRPLHYLDGDRGFVELLRMEPGVVMPRHRHTGETHVFHLRGARRIDTGEVIGPGEYSYEPPGNTDAWVVVGDEPLVAFVVVMGTVEFLDADGGVHHVASAATQRALAEKHRRL